MRILLIAPTSDLNQSPEIRDISTLHTTVVMSGAVTRRDLFDKCNAYQFDVLHFACHGDSSGVYLSNTVVRYREGEQPHERKIRLAQDPEHLSPQEISQLVRTCGAKIVVLNACTTIAVAHYVVLHGAWYAISALVDLPDNTAWKMPLLFYRNIVGDALDDRRVVEAFTVADDEAQYAMQVAPALLLRLLQVIDDLRGQVKSFGERIATDAGELRLPRRWLWGIALFVFSVYLILTVLLARLI